MEPGHRFSKVHNKNRLLLLVMKELAGNAQISFEGDSKILPLAEIQGASQEETSLLKRNTTAPRQDFVIVPLEHSTIPIIFAKIGGTVPRSVRHIQVQKNAQLAFAVYDNFHPECLSFGTAITDMFIDSLVTEGLLQRRSTLPGAATEK
jgi:hypothetical protein